MKVMEVVDTTQKQGGDSYYTNMTDKQKEDLVSKYGHHISYFDDPSDTLQELAVQQSGINIKHIIDKGIKPTPRVQELAVQQNGNAITHIIDSGIKPSHALLMMAIQQNGWIINAIKGRGISLSSDMVRTALTDPDVICCDPESPISDNKKMYDNFVKSFFPRSSLLVDRWVRYGDHIRQRKPRDTTEIPFD